MVVQPGLCRTGRKPRRPVFSERGSDVVVTASGVVVAAIKKMDIEHVLVTNEPRHR